MVKRLEKHRFKWPTDAELQYMHLSQWLLPGFDVIGHSPLNYTMSGF